MDKQEIINRLIDSINKKRKINKNSCKKRNKTAKISKKALKTTQIEWKMRKSLNCNLDIYSLNEIYNNKELLLHLSKYLSKKINSQIGVFRSVKSVTIVEFIAKECIFDCFCNDDYNIDKYIIYKYNLLYKKELNILPYLILDKLLHTIVNIMAVFNRFCKDISSGAVHDSFNKPQNYSLAKIYGIAKYNKNLLKYMQISNCNIKKCVFLFINKLTWYQNKIHLILLMINNVLKYTTFSSSSCLICE